MCAILVGEGTHMKRFIVIECDTEFSSVFVREARQDYRDGTVNYRHEAGANSLICDSPSPRFYGRLDALMITRDRIEKAKPIIIERQAETTLVERTQGPQCPNCGKVLTSADVNENCPKTLHKHGKHPIVVFDPPEPSIAEFLELNESDAPMPEPEDVNEFL